MKLNSALGILRMLAILEGISYLLFAITMPMKYMYGILGPNMIVGMAHGFLFLAYVLMCLVCAYKLKWRFTITFLALLASLIPFGTFVADAKIFKKMQR